jgi:hypothetical protein
VPFCLGSHLFIVVLNVKLLSVIMLYVVVPPVVVPRKTNMFGTGVPFLMQIINLIQKFVTLSKVILRKSKSV